jgi:acetyl-CoA C-acetyltransferase
MAAHGIAGKIAIVGMGCTPFGDLRDKAVADLLVDAATEAVGTTRLDMNDIDAFWLGTYASSVAGTTLTRPLKLRGKPVSRNENYCATGTDSFRNACFAVASGAYDTAMAIGVEKITDAGGAGIPYVPPLSAGTAAGITPPGAYSYLSVGYAAKHGVDAEELKAALTHVAWKNHSNGALNPRAMFQACLPKDTIAGAPDLAGNLSLLDCGGLSDGAAAVILCRAEDAHRYTATPIYVRAIGMTVGTATGALSPEYDYASFPEVHSSAQEAYRQAGITDPRAQLLMAEVHDCFTITELLLMEDLGFASRGTAWKEALAGTFDLNGDLPVNPDGGLKSFGHPIGASGIRMLFEAWLQLRGEAGPRQVRSGKGLALTQNLGGMPGECLSIVTVLGQDRR